MHPMKSIWLVVIIVSFLVTVKSTGAQETLSEAEQAALSQRKLTADETALQQEGCSFWGPLSQTVKFGSGVEGWLVELPDLQFLIYLSTVPDKQNPGKYSIIAYDALPNGGIGGKDFCASTKIFVGSDAPSPDGAILHLALILRKTLSVEEEYPNTFKTIREMGLLRNIASGRFALLSVNEEGQGSVIASELSGDPLLDETKDIVRLSNVLLVPLK
jgi:hypothetical protein